MEASSQTSHLTGEEKIPQTSSFQSLFDNLSHVIDVSRTKFDLVKASNNDKQKWARLLIAGVEAYAKLMETAKIEEMEQRIQAIEKRGWFNE
jgi:hypothetical protein